MEHDHYEFLNLTAEVLEREGFPKAADISAIQGGHQADNPELRRTLDTLNRALDAYARVSWASFFQHGDFYESLRTRREHDEGHYIRAVGGNNLRANLLRAFDIESSEEAEEG